MRIIDSSSIYGPCIRLRLWHILAHGSDGKASAYNEGDSGLIPGPEKAMAPHSSTLAWKIPWTEEPGRLQSMGSLRVGHDWVTSLWPIGEGNGNPLQYSCLENPRDEGAWWAAVYGVAQSRTGLKRLSSQGNKLLHAAGCDRQGVWAKIVNNNKKQTGYLFSSVCYHVHKIGFRWSSSGGFGFVSNCNWS